MFAGPPRTTFGVLWTMDCEVAAAATAFLHRLPAMVEASLGLTMIINCPTRKLCTSMIFGLHAYGTLISPTSRRIGLGFWHATCCGLGTRRALLTSTQKGFWAFEVLSDWVKSKYPGPVKFQNQSRCCSKGGKPTISCACRKGISKCCRASLNR